MGVAATSRERGSRERILAAASELARELGPNHLPLEAVAARAGVSKGGLLYNFPTKAALLRALVEGYIAEMDAALEAAVAAESGARGSFARAYIDQFETECLAAMPAASGVLAAMAENPDFMEPLSAYKAAVLDRLKRDCVSDADALLIFLTIDGLRSARLFDPGTIADADRETALARLRELASASC